MNIQEVRVKGLGNGFKVIDPEDGYQKNNRVWFGTCSLCGERVSNSFYNGVWEHKVVLEKVGTMTTSKGVDYCPAPYES